MEDWKLYLDFDFGVVENGLFRIDGYVYDADDETDTPYRLVQFRCCEIPLDKRNDEEYVYDIECECKQYISDISEKEAENAIKWYVDNMELL